MLGESAFYSSHFLRWSAQRAWFLFIGFLTVSLLLLFATLPFLHSQQWMGEVRVVCSLLVFYVSSDVLGAALSYSSAERVVCNICIRLQRAKAASYPTHDILLILGDYNSAVEGAPLMVPGIYESHRDELDRLWKER
jgi:hypothetical protein